MSTDYPDFTTVQKRAFTAGGARGFSPVLMQWDPRAEGYQYRQMGGAMTKGQAATIAKSWAKMRHIEYRRPL